MMKKSFKIFANEPYFLFLLSTQFNYSTAFRWFSIYFSLDLYLHLFKTTGIGRWKYESFAFFVITILEHAITLNRSPVGRSALVENSSSLNSMQLYDNRI